MKSVLKQFVEVAEVLVERGLSMTAGRLLVSLSEQADGQSLGVLAGKVGVSTAAMTQLSQGLVAKGLVELRHAVADRRVWEVWLTPEGWELMVEKMNFED